MHSIKKFFTLPKAQAGATVWNNPLNYQSPFGFTKKVKNESPNIQPSQNPLQLGNPMQYGTSFQQTFPKQPQNTTPIPENQLNDNTIWDASQGKYVPNTTSNLQSAGNTPMTVSANQQSILPVTPDAQEMIDAKSLIKPVGVVPNSKGSFDEVRAQEVYINSLKNKEQTPTERLNVFNPYGNVDVMSAISYGAYNAGQGNVGQASLGFGKGLLGLLRTGTSAYALGTDQKRLNGLQNNESIVNSTVLKKGGQVNLAQFLTGQYTAETPDATVEVEAGEYLKNSETGQVTEAIGEKHDNGGVKTNLPDGSQVLSDYTEVGTKNAQELSKELEVKIKAKDTYAQALEKYSNKLGIKKLIKEEEVLIKKTEENVRMKDNDTKSINLKMLHENFQEVEEKKEALNTKQSEAFQKVFQRQEAEKPQEEQTQFQDGGNVMYKNTNGSPYNKLNNGIDEVAMRGMMKSNIGMGNAMQNPSAMRMSQSYPKTGMTPEGTGTHYMSSVDNFARPLLQDMGGENLIYNENPSRSREDMRFNTPEEAQYFAEHYKEVAPMMNGKRFQDGGEVNQEQMFQELIAQGYSEEEAMQYMQQQGGGEQQPDIIAEVKALIDQGSPVEEIVAQLVQMGYSEEESSQVVQQASAMETMEGGGETDRTKRGSSGESINDFYENVKVFAKAKGVEPPKVNLKDKTKSWTEMQNWMVKNAPEDVVGYFQNEPLTNKGMSMLLKDKKAELQKLGFDTNRKVDSFTPEERRKIVQNVDVDKDFILNQFADGIAGYRFPVAPAVGKVMPMKDMSQKPVGELMRETYQAPQEKIAEKAVDKGNGVRNVIPMIPSMYDLPPSAALIPRNDQVRFDRIAPVTRSPEPQIAEANTQANFAIEQAYLNNPNLAPFLTASALSTTQASTNKAIAEVDSYNADAIGKANMYNNQVGMKEQLSNIDLANNYEKRLFSTISNQESDWRRYFNNNQMQNKQNWMDVNNLNLSNAMYDNFQSDGSNVYFQNPANFGNEDKEMKDYYKNLTPEQQNAYRNMATSQMKG